MDVYKAVIENKKEYIYVVKNDNEYEEVLTKRKVLTKEKKQNVAIKILQVVDNSDRNFYQYLMKDRKEIDFLLDQVLIEMNTIDCVKNEKTLSKLMQQIRLYFLSRKIDHKYIKQVQKEFYSDEF